MLRTFIPVKPGKMTPKKLNDMRRTLIMAMWTDLRLFGYRTQTVEHLQKKIVKAKAELK